MKSTFFKALIIMVGLTSITLSSCKKSSTAADDSVSAQDANNVSNVMSSTSDDATAAAGQVSSYKSLSLGWMGGGNLFIDATITDTSSTGIVIQYAGNNPCNGIIRSGTITVTNTGNKPWHEAGAQLTIQYTNLKVTEVLSGYVYTLNGTHTVTNVTGGLAWQVVAGVVTNTTVTHTIQSSNMQITFPNGTERNWTVDRNRTWSNAGGLLTVTVSSDNGNNTETGTNRFGDAFTNSIPSPIIGNSNCAFRPYTGEFEHQISTRMTTVQFGTNPTGTPQNNAAYCGSYGTYGYYITYNNGDVTRYRFVSYWR
jgi:hypothetical protein